LLRPSGVERPSRIRAALNRVTGQLAVFVREPGLLSVNAGITVMKWGLVSLSYYCAFRAFGVDVPVTAAATIPTISSLVGYVPVSVAGLGTMELTGMALFGRLGVPEPVVLAVYVFLRAVLILLAAVIFGVSGRSPLVPAGSRCGS
jgi:uncharacterized protein (TIRG00374 family)